MSDRYQELVHALRSAVVAPADGGETTRKQILKSLSQRLRKRRALGYVLVAACFIASSALAYYVAQSERSGAAPALRNVQRKPAGVELGSPAPSTRPASSMPASASEPAPAPADEEAARGAESVPARAPALRSPARPSRTRHFGSRSQRAQPALSNSRPARPVPAQAAGAAPLAASQPRRDPATQQALYIAAHRLHFRGAPQAALAAWNAYLASEPTGPAALEARYNRAVVLMRLGRNSEARSALEPFALGTHAGFRQAEARQLLQQLR